MLCIIVKSKAYQFSLINTSTLLGESAATRFRFAKSPQASGHLERPRDLYNLMVNVMQFFTVDQQSHEACMYEYHVYI